MGAMREFAYAFTDVSYDFLRLVSVEFLYEYRKDVFTFLQEFQMCGEIECVWCVIAVDIASC